MIINNYGTIFATDDDNVGTNTIKSDDDSTPNVTIINFKGGHIYHTSESDPVVVVGGSATLTNSGKIENKDGPSQNAITLSTFGATGATLILKDSGIVIGKINITNIWSYDKSKPWYGTIYYMIPPVEGVMI